MAPIERSLSYAKGTTVPVEKTRAEIDRLLAKHGATQRLIGIDEPRNAALVGFTLAERQVRLIVPLPSIGNLQIPRGRGEWAERARRARAQAERERWRAVLMLVRAKLEAIALGLTTVEREFLADISLPDGRRVGAVLAPLLAEAYKTGQMPAMLGPAAEEP